MSVPGFISFYPGFAHPTMPDEWAALRTELLRSLYNGYQSALAAVAGT